MKKQDVLVNHKLKHGNTEHITFDFLMVDDNVRHLYFVSSGELYFSAWADRDGFWLNDGLETSRNKVFVSDEFKNALRKHK